MGNLTSNQKEILKNLTLEFERINNSTNQNNKFNLINLDVLVEEQKAVNLFIKEAEQDKLMWNNLANEEAKRITQLLKEDLHPYCVQKYGKENGHGDYPTIMIRNNENSSTHSDDCVFFSVEVDKEKREFKGNNQDFGTSLFYKFYTCRYNEISGLMEDKYFISLLKKRVIDK